MRDAFGNVREPTPGRMIDQAWTVLTAACDIHDHDTVTVVCVVA